MLQRAGRRTCRRVTAAWAGSAAEGAGALITAARTAVQGAGTARHDSEGGRALSRRGRVPCAWLLGCRRRGSARKVTSWASAAKVKARDV